MCTCFSAGKVREHGPPAVLFLRSKCTVAARGVWTRMPPSWRFSVPRALGPLTGEQGLAAAVAGHRLGTGFEPGELRREQGLEHLCTVSAQLETGDGCALRGGQRGGVTSWCWTPMDGNLFKKQRHVPERRDGHSRRLSPCVRVADATTQRTPVPGQVWRSSGPGRCRGRRFPAETTASAAAVLTRAPRNVCNVPEPVPKWCGISAPGCWRDVVA